MEIFYFFMPEKMERHSEVESIASESNESRSARQNDLFPRTTNQGDCGTERRLQKSMHNSQTSSPQSKLRPHWRPQVRPYSKVREMNNRRDCEKYVRAVELLELDLLSRVRNFCSALSFALAHQ